MVYPQAVIYGGGGGGPPPPPPPVGAAPPGGKPPAVGETGVAPDIVKRKKKESEKYEDGRLLFVFVAFVFCERL